MVDSHSQRKLFYNFPKSFNTIDVPPKFYTGHQCQVSTLKLNREKKDWLYFLLAYGAEKVVENSVDINIKEKEDKSDPMIFTTGSQGSKDGEFSFPRDVCFSQNGDRIYVADEGNKRMQVFNSAGVHVRSVGGQKKRVPIHVQIHHSSSFTSLNGNESASPTSMGMDKIDHFNQPCSITRVGHGNIAVMDKALINPQSSNRIHVLRSMGSRTRYLIADLSANSTALVGLPTQDQLLIANSDWTCDLFKGSGAKLASFKLTGVNSKFNKEDPVKLAINNQKSNILYMTRSTSMNIECFDLTQQRLINSIKINQFGPQPFQPISSGLAVNSQGLIYLGDALNHSIMLFDPRLERANLGSLISPKYQLGAVQSLALNPTEDKLAVTTFAVNNAKSHALQMFNLMGILS